MSQITEKTVLSPRPVPTKLPLHTLFTITVDTEEEWDWNGGWPTENLALTNIRCLPEFQQLCARHGAAVTFFTNHAVLDNPEARQTILALAKQPRVEIGMHIHPWNTPPLMHKGPIATRETFIHNLPPDVALAKLDTVYQAFLANGLKPTSFRGGRYSAGPVAQRFLRSHGFIADSSVVPYTSWLDDGAPDYLHRDLLPVRTNPEGVGEGALWEIPLSFGFTRRPFRMWGKVYHRIERSLLRHLRLLGLADRLGLLRKFWLSFESPLGQNMAASLRKLRRLDLPCVNFTLHSSSLLPGGSPFTRTAADRDRLFAQVDEVLRFLSQWDDFQPATVSEVATHLENEYHARYRN